MRKRSKPVKGLPTPARLRKRARERAAEELAALRLLAAAQKLYETAEAIAREVDAPHVRENLAEARRIRDEHSWRFFHGRR